MGQLAVPIGETDTSFKTKLNLFLMKSYSKGWLGFPELLVLL